MQSRVQAWAWTGRGTLTRAAQESPRAKRSGVSFFMWVPLVSLFLPHHWGSPFIFRKVHATSRGPEPLSPIRPSRALPLKEPHTGPYSDVPGPGVQWLANHDTRYRLVHRYLVPDLLADEAGAAAAELSGRPAGGGGGARAVAPAAARHLLGDRAAQEPARRGGARGAVPPPGGRLRRELRGLHLAGDHQQAEDPAPDEPGAGAWRPPPRHPRGALRRPIRQAAQRGPGDARRRHPAV